VTQRAQLRIGNWNEEIDTSEPSRAEVRKAIGPLKNGNRQVSTTYKQSCLKLTLIMPPLKSRRS